MTAEERQRVRLAIDVAKRKQLSRASVRVEGRDQERRRASWRAYYRRRKAAA